jgi:hypothetical protein
MSAADIEAYLHWFLSDQTPAVALGRMIRLNIHLIEELEDEGRNMPPAIYQWMLNYDPADDFQPALKLH